MVYSLEEATYFHEIYTSPHQVTNSCVWELLNCKCSVEILLDYDIICA